MTNTTALYYMHGHIDQSGRYSEYDLPDQGDYSLEIGLSQSEYEVAKMRAEGLNLGVGEYLQTVIAKHLRRQGGGNG